MITQHPIKFNPDRFGFKFGSIVKGKGGTALHSGIDYNGGDSPNADFLMEVNPVFGGTVVFAKNCGEGWGNVVVIYSDLLKRWNRIAHLHKIYVKVGEIVDLTSVIGLLGKSGTGSPHCHCDVIKQKLTKWTEYTWGWNDKRLNAFYENPLTFIEMTNKKFEIPDWALESYKRALASGIQIENPHKEIDQQEFQRILKESGIIKEDGPIPVYRLLVIIEKLKGII